MPHHRLGPLLLAALAMGGCTPRPTTEPIVVGHVAPLTGPNKAAGLHAQNALRLAVQEVNQEQQRIAGRRVEVHHVDSRGDATEAQYAAVRLLSVNRAVALIGGPDPALHQALARAAQPYGAPLLTPAGPAEGDPDLVYAVGLAPAWQGRCLARFAAGPLKAERLAVVVDRKPPWAAPLTAALLKEWPEKAGARPVEIDFPGDDKRDTLPAEVEKARPQGVVFVGGVADLQKLRRGLNAAGSKAPVLLGGEEGSVAVLREDRALKGPVYVASAFHAGGGAGCERFVRKYREQYGADPDAHAALAYDGAWLLFGGLGQARPLDGPRAAARGLAELTTFDSLTGTVPVERLRRGQRGLFVLRVEDGAETLAQRYDPES